MTSSDPILIGALRGGAVESVHRVHAVVAGPDGDAIHQWGGLDRPVFPRSALKAMQALPLVETGAADHFGCTPAELALACASHEGEAMHVDGASGLLSRLGLDQDALACGPQWPRRVTDHEALVRQGAAPGRAHNNCSGKHAGMLATATHLGEAPDGYVGRGHGVQRRIFDAISDLADHDLTAAPVGVDGCSAPNPALPLLSFAVAAARFAEASADRLGATRAQACQRLMAAMQAAPEMVGGTARVDTDLIRAGGGRVLSKTGAEGVYVLYLPEASLGVALKAEDGAARAATAALWSVLERLNLLDDALRAALDPHCRPEIRNWDGLVTGAIVEI